MTGVLLPEPVRLAAERAERAGFTMSCAPGTGRLLAVLAAAVPANGRVLELGTGTKGLDTTIAALRPGAHLLVDDMTPGEFADDHHARKTAEVRARLPGSILTSLNAATSVMIA